MAVENHLFLEFLVNYGLAMMEKFKDHLYLKCFIFLKGLICQMDVLGIKLYIPSPNWSFLGQD